MCQHLVQLENELKKLNIKETFRGQAWSENCNEWVYFDCYFDVEELRKRFAFPDFIKHRYNNDNKSGLEEGFVCTKCNDAIIGLNSFFKKQDGKKTIK